MDELYNASRKFVMKNMFIMNPIKHICIVGAGAAGWIAYHSLKNRPEITKITVIGAPSIPIIGVGESTTRPFYNWVHNNLGLSDDEVKKFLVDIDAAVKYGVSYEGWSPNTFLHHFTEGNKNSIKESYRLGKKPKHINHNQVSVPLAKYNYQNKVYLSDDGTLDQTLQGSTYHFDAAKFIQTLHDLAKNDKKLNFISDKVVGSQYKGDKVEKLFLESGNEITADYYISCIGQTGFNQKVFNEEYISYSDVLLTTKALFCPLEYTDPVDQFHPYTVAKAMSHGWRWITPTRSRIGTGYVFSDNHISIDQAVDELVKDIGDKTVTPHVVDFFPRRVKEVFKANMCTMGMASGFQEPLDAPGLSHTQATLSYLNQLLDQPFVTYHLLKEANKIILQVFNFWCSFILHQYKTCHRNDTQFWQDHKNVKFEWYEQLIDSAFNKPVFENQILMDYRNRRVFHDSLVISPEQAQVWRGKFWTPDIIMFYKTSSGKDIQWELNSPTNWNWDFELPEKPDIDMKRIVTHREYIDKLEKN